MDILAFINAEMEAAGIPYEYGEWTDAVSYPYVVGSFTETEYRFEDGCTLGALTLDAWARGANANEKLLDVKNKIKRAFSDRQSVQDGKAFFIRYGGSFPTQTGEEELSKITITLFTYEWEGA